MMKVNRTRVTVVLLVLTAATLVQVLAAGIGISGPEQTFELDPGEGTTSYLTVWNEGDSQQSFEATVEGGVSPLLSLSPSTFQVSSGSSRTITLTYSVPQTQEHGTYSGRVQVTASGNGISPSVSRVVEILVGGSGQGGLALKSGLNLITWTGSSGSFDELSLEGMINKIWCRKNDGSYCSVTYYHSTGQWWGPDPAFNGLETGGAYFFESSTDGVLQTGSGGFPGPTSLSAGLNLIGWPYASMGFDQAFPQSSQDFYVIKVWRRKPDGSYSFAQYYPGSDDWWSSDQDFTGLESGKAYFVEANRAAEVNP